MTQAKIASGDLNGYGGFTGGNDGTLVLETGLAGAKVNAISIDTVGMMTLAANQKIPVASGSAPVYGIRAWVNFTISGGVCTIQNSGNIASVNYVALGNYRITFTQAMNNANYGIIGTCKALASNQTLIVCTSTGVAPTAAGCDVYTTSGWADGLTAAAFKEAATVSLIFIG